MVVGEAAVRLGEECVAVAAERRDDPRRDRPAGAVAGVDDDLELPRQRPELRDQLLLVRRDDRVVLFLAARRVAELAGSR